MSFQIFSSCTNWRGKNGLFWKGGRRGAALQDYHLVDVRHEKVSPSSKNTYFSQKDPIKVKILETFECSNQNLWNSLCQFWSNKLISLQILYPSSVSWKITPLNAFSAKNICFAQKGPIKVETFETFECSGQNLSNSLCQFWNDKLISF